MMAKHNHVIRLFQSGDIAYLPFRDSIAYRRLSQAAQAVYEKNPSWSLFCNGHFVAAGGFVRPYVGLAEGWAIAGPLVRRHPVLFHRIIKHYLYRMPRQLQIRRVQCLVDDSYKTGQAWAERLGFTEEARFRNYGPDGQTMIMYAFYPEDHP